MNNRFDAVNEAVDFAIEQEIGASEFYLDLAKKVNIAAMKDVFESFAKEEQGHRIKLEKLKGSGAMELSDEAEDVPDLQISDYTVDVQPSPDMNYKDALVLAMKKEKAAYRLYIDLAAIAISEDITNMFLWLAQEEAKHKLRFEIEYYDVVLKEN